MKARPTICHPWLTPPAFFSLSSRIPCFSLSSRRPCGLSKLPFSHLPLSALPRSTSVQIIGGFVLGALPGQPPPGTAASLVGEGSRSARRGELVGVLYGAAAAPHKLRKSSSQVVNSTVQPTVDANLAAHLTAPRAWCTRCLPYRIKPDVLRPGIGSMRGSMVNRVRLCTK